MPAAELPILTVAHATAFSLWLVRCAETSPGVWLTLAKKGVAVPTSLTYAQALEEALCHGWIDGQARSCDAKTFFHRFTPRTKTSKWSKRNVGIVERLEAEGRMMARGRGEVERAKRDGRVAGAYEGSANMEPTPELVAAIAEDPKAQEVWDGLTKQNRYAFCLRLAALKTEAGKRKRVAATVESLRKWELPYPQKQGRVSRKASTPASGTSVLAKQAPSRIEKGTEGARRSSRVKKSSFER